MRSKTKTTFHSLAVSEYEDPGDYNRQFYTPTATKPPLLIALLCAILACVALLQVAAFKSVKGTAVGSSSHAKRQVVSSSSTTFTSQASAITEASYLDTSTPSAVGSSATAPAAYLDTTSSSVEPTTYSTPDTTAYLDTSTPSAVGSSATAPAAYLDTTSSSVEPTTYSTPDTTAYLDTSTPPPVLPPSTTISSAYLDTSTPTTTESLASISTAYLDTSQPGTTAVSATIAYLDTSKPGTPSASTTTAYAEAAGSSPSAPTSTTPTAAILGTSTPATGISPTTAPVQSESPASSYLDTSTPESTIASGSLNLDTSLTPSSAATAHLYASSPQPPTWSASTVASTPSGTVIMGVTAPTISTLIIEPTPASTTSNAYLAISTAKTSTNPTSKPPGVVDITALPATDRLVTGTFTSARYYTGTYLCPLIVVLLKTIWGTVFASTKMVEPFYQLTRPGGVDARASLLADYLSSGFSTTALSSLFTARPVMLTAILVSAMTSVMAPIASEAMSIQPSDVCPVSDGQYHRCAPVWILSMPCIRLLQAFLGSIFCLITVYLVLNFRRDSGIFSDPSSIASVASLLGNDDFLQELRDIPADASKKDIRRLLAGNKYILATFTRDSGKPTYGIVRADEGRWHDGYHVTNLQHTSSPKVGKSSSKSGYLHDIFLSLLSGGILAVILYYYKDGKDDGFNRFFNSSGFGPRFILSAAATVLDNRWKRLEREVRMMQPYRTLYRRAGSKASTKALLGHTASTTYTSFATALWRGDFFLALVSFVAILADALIIAVVGVPFSYGQVYSSFQISTWLSVSILGLMILTSLAVMLFWRRGHPKGMPREPNTLMAVALYLCASQVTEQLVPLSMVSQKHRDEVVRSWRGRYWFGYALGLDGKARWVVDRDEGGFEPSRGRESVGERFTDRYSTLEAVR